MQRRPVILVLVASASLTFGACSSSGSSAATTTAAAVTTTTAPAAVTTTAGVTSTTIKGPGTGTPFCDQEIALQNAKGPLNTDNSNPSPASVQAFFETFLPPKIKALQAAAPSAIAGDMNTMAEGYAKITDALRTVGWDLSKAIADPTFSDLLNSATYQAASDHIDVFCGAAAPATTAG